jgi:metallo-beta-lactamase family protein
MRIQFCGADRTVTGSCHLLEINGLRLLLDLGLYQGSRDEANRINTVLPDRLKSADAIILSHAHLDHCGRLPVAARLGYAGPIYCTPATAAIAEIVLRDAAKIQLEDAQYLNRRTRGTADIGKSPSGGQEPIAPLYGANDVEAAVKLFRTVAYDTPTDLGRGVRFSFHDAGHILGSAYVTLNWNEAGKDRSVLFTADVGRYDAPILRDPATLGGAFDDVITESTYGNTTHAPMAQVGPQLLAAVQSCIARKGRLLIPSFAVGRTQTVLWYLQRFIQAGQIPAIPIFVDSPMAVKVSEVHRKFPEMFDDQTLKAIGPGGDLFSATRVTFASTTDQSKAINGAAGPAVIIAASPTCEFGRILHHLKASLERPADLVLFVGWIPPQTLGRRLQDGQKRVRVLDRFYDVRCGIKTIHGLSAHADGDELLRFLAPTLKVDTTAHVVHGEVPQAEGFAARLLRAGVGRAIVPAMQSSELAGESPAPPPTAPPGSGSGQDAME